MLAFPPLRLYNRFMNEAFHLARLQKTDTQIDQAAARLAEIARLLANDETVRTAQTIETDTRAKMEQARKALKRLEDAVAAQRLKIEYSEAALYGGKVKNPKELQDLQNEIASLKKYLATLEDQQLEAMMALEQAESDHASAADLLARAQADFTSRSSALVGEQSRLQKDVERLQAERTPNANQISPETLQMYDRLRRQKKGLAVAGIVDSCCTACGSTLTQADWQTARSPNQISFCPFCGRILYAG